MQQSQHFYSNETGAPMTLDDAIDAYRADPTEENRARLMAAQEAHMDNFHGARAAEYIARCR